MCSARAPGDDSAPTRVTSCRDHGPSYLRACDAPSDNGLRKVCKALNFPLPHVGHWAKVAAGRNVPRIPLSDEAPRTTFVSRPREVERAVGVTDDEAWLTERLA